MVSPLMLIILDGFGFRMEEYGNAIALAKTPYLDFCFKNYPYTLLSASGKDVGLPEGQMGNSEVGHLNIGAGRIVYQDLLRINNAIEDGLLETNATLLKVVEFAVKNNSWVHLLGLLSDGGVHSHIDHLFALLLFLKKKRIENVKLHIFLDGRDVYFQSAKKYVLSLQEKLKSLNLGKLVTMHGRYYAMDRDKRFERTKKSYDAIVYGKGLKFLDPLEALDYFYSQNIFDEFALPVVFEDRSLTEEQQSFVLEKDVLIFFNFRKDRMKQLVSSFVERDFSFFKTQKFQELYVVTLTQYFDALNLDVIFKPLKIKDSFGEIISKNGLKQLRIAETEKYPHVTYFFNGGKEEPFENEKRILIPSPKVATYDLEPQMSALKITSRLLEELKKNIYDIVILNFANPDMVGHSGKLQPTIMAIETIDRCLGEIVPKVIQKGGIVAITSDHGNAEVMLDENKMPVTSHTTSLVPFILTSKKYSFLGKGILGDIAPTLLELLNIEKPVEMTGRSLLR